MPALRWLSGQLELGGEPGAWQRWMRARAERREEDTPRPDAVICIVDASNAERHLYLATQMMRVLMIPTEKAQDLVFIMCVRPYWLFAFLYL